MMKTERDYKCVELVEKHMISRMDDITKLWDMYKNDPEASDPDLGTFDEYGLCLDYVSGGTDYNDEAGYIRYQLSTGGPGDEFRFFVDANLHLYKIEYWYLDWFDGAPATPNQIDQNILREIFDDWKECGTIEHLVKQGSGD